MARYHHSAVECEMFDPLIARMVLVKIMTAIHGIDYVANFIRSEDSNLRQEAEAILDKIKETATLAQLQMDTHNLFQEKPSDLEISLDVEQYVRRLSNAYENGDSLLPIAKEANHALMYFQEVLDGNDTDRYSF